MLEDVETFRRPSSIVELAEGDRLSLREFDDAPVVTFLFLIPNSTFPPHFYLLHFVFCFDEAIAGSS